MVILSTLLAQKLRRTKITENGQCFCKMHSAILLMNCEEGIEMLYAFTIYIFNSPVVLGVKTDPF